MFKLFTPFDWDATEARALKITMGVLEDCAKASIPNLRGLAETCADYATGYVCEVARCRGQESRDANNQLVMVHEILCAFEVAGILGDDIIAAFDRDMREFLFDELRRCGIGSYRGYFEPEEEQAED